MSAAALSLYALRSIDGSLMGGHEDGTDSPGDCSRSRSTEEAAAFDRWLNEKLNILYNPVLAEPIPEDLIRLIEAHRRSAGQE